MYGLFHHVRTRMQGRWDGICFEMAWNLQSYGMHTHRHIYTCAGRSVSFQAMWPCSCGCLGGSAWLWQAFSSGGFRWLFCLKACSDWFLHEHQFAYGDSCFLPVLPESLWWSCVPRPVPASGEGWLGMVWQVVCYFAALALSMYGAMLHRLHVRTRSSAWSTPQIEFAVQSMVRPSRLRDCAPP